LPACPSSYAAAVAVGVVELGTGGVSAADGACQVAFESCRRTWPRICSCD